MRVALAEAFPRDVRALSEAQRLAVLEAMLSLPRAVGAWAATTRSAASFASSEPLLAGRLVPQRRGAGVAAASCCDFSSTSAWRASHWDMRAPVSHISF